MFCGTNSNILEGDNYQKRVIKIINVLGQSHNIIGNASILLYIYDDGTVKKIHNLNH